MLKVEIKTLDSRLEEWGGSIYSATQGAAAFDVRACAVFQNREDGKPNLSSRSPIAETITIPAGSVVYIGLGFAMHIESKEYAAFIIPRSSSSSTKLVLGNTIGLIDSDYTGEVIAALYNAGTKHSSVSAGDRIAQMYFAPVITPEIISVKEFTSKSIRGSGGFGSTGV